MSNILVIICAWLWIVFAPSSFFSLNDFLSIISRIYGLTRWRYFCRNKWSDKKNWSLNCKSIVLPLSQVEIPAKKRKHLTLKIVSAITNDVQLDSLNELQIIRVTTDRKVLKGEFVRNFKLVRKESSADV